jgi:hypothetical protein
LAPYGKRLTGSCAKVALKAQSPGLAPIPAEFKRRRIKQERRPISGKMTEKRRRIKTPGNWLATVRLSSN